MSEPARWTQQQYDDHIAKFNGGQEDKSHHVKAPPKRITARAKKPNATESAWAAELTRKGVAWRWEAITLKLANDCRYTPDFFAIERDGCHAFWEVKREWKNRPGRPRIEDDALVKLKVAAKEYPEFDFWLVWLGVDGNWREERIEA